MNKVLVLGAGASCAYGYPLGWELRQQILTLPHDPALRSGIISEWDSTQRDSALTQFQTAFRESQSYSIDAFLARRTEFAEIGKKCIAHILLSCEERESLFSEQAGKDHWYQYLLNQYNQVDWEDLSFSDLSIITFNYDRSLEHYFLFSLQAAYGKSQDEVIEKLATLRIVHVYGALGPTYPNNTDRYRRYDSLIVDPRWVNIAAESIHVIPEGRISNDAELHSARDLLEQADGICFLGFGFDKLNVERISQNQACSVWKLRDGRGYTTRNVTGTSYGMTDRESARAWRRLAHNDRLSFQMPENSFMSTNCTQLLRETLFLD